jgi:hypothetical protein
MITGCEINDPTGHTCVFFLNQPSGVYVNGGSDRINQCQLSITGLKDPHAFKRLVLAVKRAYHPAAASLPRALDIIGRGQETNEDVTALLRDIREELRQQNQAIQSLKPSATAKPEPVDFKSI